MPIRPTPNSNQAKLNRLNAMAQRGPLGQTSQRDLAYLQNKMGVNPQVPPENVQQVSGAAPFTPQAGGPQLPGGTPQGGPISGPGPGLMGGVAAPGTSNMPNASLPPGFTYKKGGKVKKMASGGMTSKSSSASRRGDGIAKRGKTKGRMV